MIKRLILLVALAIPAAADDGGIRVVSWPIPKTATGSATLGAVSVSTTPVTLLAGREGRLKVILFNEKETLYIKAGAGASTSDYSWRMPPATSLEINAYTGPISAVLGVIGPTTVHVTDL